MHRGIWFLASLFGNGNRGRILCVVLGGVMCMQGCEQGTPTDKDGSGGTDTGGTASGGAGTGGTASGGTGVGGTDCEALSENECTVASGCQPYLGYPIEESAACFDEEAGDFFGCHDPGCPGQERAAEDENGNVWHFPGGCTPPEWEDRGFSNGGPCDASGGQGGMGGDAP